MQAKEIREKFLQFFEDRKHKIVASAPIVLKDDPTLMFTNAGMNQFKDYFLGNPRDNVKRAADTQKCLRVTGKHNDLEDVGIDSYHHTMFEMLGNWSFGDYFKKEAIGWAWELLTEVFKIPEENLYVTVFSGDANDNLEADQEAADLWGQFIPKEHILYFDRKDNFWEMGSTGPCGPCSEIHIDLRSASEKEKVPGADLVNMDHPQVIEVWNLVFIQFNRKSDGVLIDLPDKHVDTGMGFERLCMALQGKTSNYDTDIFAPFIKLVEKASGIEYGSSYAPDAKTDIAMRVIVDHIRAISFAIADGELPSNTGAGYVIRRILRRAVRYYYSFLSLKTPFLYSLVDELAEAFKDVFPELDAQKDFVAKVVLEEEKSFLRTLEEGLKRIGQLKIKNNILDGKTAFELYDTYGFPIDLTRLIASEEGWGIDEEGFELALQAQKSRSREDAKKVAGDWNQIKDGAKTEFVGYDTLEVEESYILKYRMIQGSQSNEFQFVLDSTPFYPEGGGQIGDQGFFLVGEEKIAVLDTKKENEQIIHYLEKLPENLEAPVKAVVHRQKRRLTENNHTATHLMHAALREVLGAHVQQKGSLVTNKYLRFDFSHYEKLSDEQIAEVERIVNQKIRENVPLGEERSIEIAQAKEAGAMMLFGEKYGDRVRMISFDPNYSIELCGGCHVPATGKIGLFKIISESAIASGVRRIEAVTADGAEAHINKELEELSSIRGLFKNPVHTAKLVYQIQEENKSLKKQLDKLMVAQAGSLKSSILKDVTVIKGMNVISKVLPLKDSKAAKTLAYQIEGELGNVVILFGLELDGKAQLMLTISENLVKEQGLHAGNMVRELAKNIKGGGGGQAFFATAGGKDPAGLEEAIKALESQLN